MSASAQALYLTDVDPTPWFCRATCTAIIGRYDVYVDDGHITSTYARYLEGVLAAALHLPDLQPLPSAVPDLHTDLVVLASKSMVSGTTYFDASTTDNVGVKKVEFHFSGGAVRGTLIRTGRPTLYGWIASWDTTTIANGTYRVQSVAYDVAGMMARSKPATVVVDNR